MVTIGASLLYYPIKYILYDYFPYYIDLSILNSRISEFSGGFYLPALNLLGSILIETLFLFSFSLFLYHKFREYSSEGKVVKKVVLVISVSLFYILYNSFFFQSFSPYIPHIISRVSGLIIFFILIKYFWKNNPLSHLFGILIYFLLDRIFSFISFVDSTLKIQGWFLLI